MRPKRVGFAAVVAIGLVYAQGIVVERPQFEVASIKLNRSGQLGRFVHAYSGGRLSLENYELTILIRMAWDGDVKDFQITGGPSWVRSDRYDIDAKTESNLSDEQMRPLLRTLLEERFKLSIHRETKEAPVYDMVAARSGLKLAAAKEGSCVSPDPKNPAPPPPGKIFCGGLRMGKGRMAGAGISTSLLAGALSDVLGREVIDKSGFKGTFDFNLEFAPDETIANEVVAGRLAQGAPSVDSPTVSIFIALQEQLGLRLQAAKGPVEMLVIDHVERPSEN